MSQSTIDKQAGKATSNSIKDQPPYTVPVILAILMLSAGGFMLLLANAIKVFDSMGY